jgi:hypothetical protein
MFRSAQWSTLASTTLLALALGASAAFADDVKLPQTAAEHEALAKTYREQTASYKQSAQAHRQMAADYAKQHPDFKGGVKNPWNEKMSKHCEALAKDFDQLAADTEVAADFHHNEAGEIAAEAKLPQTAADHETQAKGFREQAAMFKQGAQTHRQMAAAYARQHPDPKGVKNPWNEKMSKHSEGLAKDYERLAADADKAAEFHAMRAKELQGK